jgi:capsular polysaccharide transport system ATP-binding protein
MIQLSNVTDEPHIFGDHHLLLESANLTLPHGRYALLSSSPEFHTALVDILSGARPPGHGVVRHDALASWPIGRGGFIRGKLNGFQMTRFICAVYGVDSLACIDFLSGIMTSPEFLSKRILEWPSYVRQEYTFSLPLAFNFEIYFIDQAIPTEASRFSRLWRSLFEERLFGKTLILAGGRGEQLLDYCTKGLIYEHGTFRIENDLEQCIQRYTLRQSRAEQPGGGGGWDDDPELGESGADNTIF